jgi:Fe-S-cluster containining protein
MNESHCKDGACVTTKDDRIAALLAELAARHNLLDQLAAAVTAEYHARGGKVFCAKGCSNCCTLVVNCTFPEALLIAESLDERQAGAVDAYAAGLFSRVQQVSDLKGYLRMNRKEMGGCPFLSDGACGIYRVRPASCRALLSTMENSWCGADFSELSADEKKLYMDSLDRSITAFPLHYMASTQETGTEMERLTAVNMSKIFGFSLYGNMPVMVHLIKRHRLLDAVQSGREQVEGLLCTVLPDNRFLVETGAF